MAISAIVKIVQDSLLGNFRGQLVVCLVLVPALYVVINEAIRYNARIPQLKGPTGLPMTGNLHQIRTNAAEQYRRWSRSYGGVYQIQLGNIPIVVVNTAAAAKTIFGQNAQSLSSRPEFYTFHKVSDASRAVFGILLNMFTGIVEYSRYYNWHVPVQRFSQEAEKGGRLSFEPAINSDVRFSPRYRDKRFLQRIPGIRKEWLDCYRSHAYDPTPVPEPCIDSKLGNPHGFTGRQAFPRNNTCGGRSQSISKHNWQPSRLYTASASQSF